MGDIALEHCPFCDSEAYLRIENDHHGDFFYLGCSKKRCIAHYVAYSEPIEDLQKVVDKWNTRKGVSHV